MLADIVFIYHCRCCSGYCSGYILDGRRASIRLSIAVVKTNRLPSKIIFDA